MTTPSDTTSAALEAGGLRYSTDVKPGITRQQTDDGWTYHDTDGKRITDSATIDRINSLGIPPAYTDVWICPEARGHIQATGRDARGRKQYRYHPSWRKVRDEAKFHRMLEFGKALPALRATVEQHLRLQGMPREKVLATVVRLLETTLIRVGNDEYARSNKSYGLTTMRDKHVDIKGSRVKFTFTGKSGKRHTISLTDRKLAAIVKRSRDLPGYDLFQYLDEDGTRCDVTSDDVNTYLREVTGQDFTAKDFRTWAGTVLAALALQEYDSFEHEAQARRNIAAAVKDVASQLGNTPAIARKSYIHPEIIDAYLEGNVISALEQHIDQEIENPPPLKPEEHAVMRLLQRRLAQERRSDAARSKRQRKRAA